MVGNLIHWCGFKVQFIIKIHEEQSITRIFSYLEICTFENFTKFGIFGRFNLKSEQKNWKGKKKRKEKKQENLRKSTGTKFVSTSI